MVSLVLVSQEQVPVVLLNSSLWYSGLMFALLLGGKYPESARTGSNTHWSIKCIVE